MTEKEQQRPIQRPISVTRGEDNSEETHSLFDNDDELPRSVEIWLASLAIMFALWVPIALTLTLYHPELITNNNDFIVFSWDWLTGPIYAEFYAYLMAFWIIVSGMGGGLAVALRLLDSDSDGNTDSGENQ